MKAQTIRYVAPRQIEWLDVDVPDPAAGEVQVQNKACGICAWDLATFRNGPDAPYPAPPGHEGCGVVTKVGPNVADFKEGDNVCGLGFQSVVTRAAETFRKAARRDRRLHPVDRRAGRVLRQRRPTGRCVPRRPCGRGGLRVHGPGPDAGAAPHARGRVGWRRRRPLQTGVGAPVRGGDDVSLDPRRRQAGRVGDAVRRGDRGGCGPGGPGHGRASGAPRRHAGPVQLAPRPHDV